VLGRTGVGIAIPAGRRKADFSTVEAFRRELLDAKAITTSGEGSSGRYVLALLDRLGIADAVKPKIRAGAAGSAAHFVARGEVDFAVIGLPPVLGVPGVEWLGWLPAEIQNWLVFTGGLATAAKEPEAGRALLRFLTTPAAVAVFKAKGLEPLP
jgi:molybdate transport system substrate-binding protein